MGVNEPPPDPFAGMSPEVRKRTQETIILEMTYDMGRFTQVVPRERPDFALYQYGIDQPFGVEVTQLFGSESQARLNLVHGYMHRLWSGGTHLHKRDVKVLNSVRVEIKDADGNIKQSDVPAIITQSPTINSFHASLAEAIRLKSGRGYDESEFTHLNLVILDWYHLEFNASEYLTDRFFNDDVRVALRESPFHEVFLLIYNTSRPDGDESDRPIRPDLRIIPMQQTLAMERFFVTARVVETKCRESLRDLHHLARLTVDHVTRVQGYGEPVEHEGRLFIHYKGVLIELSDKGMQVRDSNDLPVTDVTPCTINDRLPAAEEARVTEQASRHVFGCGYAPQAYHSHLLEDMEAGSGEDSA
jgi:hypothetical protein